MSKVRLDTVIDLLTDYHANGSYKTLKENVVLLDAPNHAVMVRTTNFEQNNFSDNLKFIDKNAYDHLKKSKVYSNDIIMNKIANAGACYIMPDINEKVSLGMNLFLIRLNTKKADPYYVFSYLKFNEHYVKSFASGSSTKTITKDDVRQLKIHLPTLDKQKSIVETLKTWDVAIEKTEALIDTKERQFGWLVTRLINRSGHKKKQLSDFISEVSVRNRGNEINRVLSVTNRNGFVLPEDQFERRVASANVTNYKVVQQGQYAYNPSRINVGSIARLDDWSDGILSPMYTVFKLDQKMANSDYFLHWLSSSEAKQRIKKSAQGSVRETVSFGDLGAIPICLPELSVQQNIANTLNTAKQEITLLKKLADQYRTQKRGLMQKLLSGSSFLQKQESRRG